MDNFTHSLVGWALSRAGLKRKTGLATPMLVIAANIPDIDATCTVYGTQALAMRRGLTHGPLAMIVLPVLLWAAMLAFDRWQTRRGTRPEGRIPVDSRWLLALAFIGCFSHPALDWMNSYGVRLLAPFSQRWFYGDTLFIIDVWIWSALALGIAVSRRREKSGRSDWARPAIWALVALLAYIGVNRAITVQIEQRARTNIVANLGIVPDQVVANPVPVLFWQRDVLWQTGDRVGWGDGTDNDPGILGTGQLVRPSNRGNPFVAEAGADDRDAAAFLFWSRMPYADIQATPDGHRVILHDARFANPLVSDRFTVAVDVPD